MHERNGQVRLCVAEFRYQYGLHGHARWPILCQQDANAPELHRHSGRLDARPARARQWRSGTARQPESEPIRIGEYRPLARVVLLGRQLRRRGLLQKGRQELHRNVLGNRDAV